MRTYQCEGCEATFTGTAEEAFEEGWDTPERFMSHCTCPNCTIDKTLYWQILIWQKEHGDEPFPATAQQLEMLMRYNQIYYEANPVGGDAS